MSVEREFKQLFQSFSDSNTNIMIDYANKLSSQQLDIGGKVIEKINEKLEKLDKLDKLDSIETFASPSLPSKVEHTKSSGSFSALPPTNYTTKTASIITQSDVLVAIRHFEPIDSISLKKSFPQLSQREVEQLIRKLLKQNKIYRFGKDEYKINGEVK